MNTEQKRICFFVLAALIAVFTALGAAYYWYYYTMPADAPDYLHAHIDIMRVDGQKFPFDVEVATTPRQLEYGLMHRHLLPANAGMLFLYDKDEEVRMWMKNTFLPLDILFMRDDGTIVTIITHAMPFDLTPLSSSEPVRSALEVNAGTVVRLGIKTGDKVSRPVFDKN